MESLRWRAIWRPLAIVGLVLLGLGLRLHRIGSWPLHGDELSSLAEVRDFAAGEGVAAYWVKATSPLAHASLRASMHLVGDNVFGLRLAPLLFGALALILVHPLMRSAFGATAAFASLLVVALSPDHIAISSFGRYYSAVFLCGMLVLAGQTLLAVRGSRLGVTLVLIGLAAGTAFHLTTLLLLPGVLFSLGLCASDREDRPRARAAMLGLGVIVLAIVLAASARWSELAHVYRNVRFNFPRELGYRPTHLVLSLASSLGIGTCLFAAAGAWWVLVTRSRGGLAILLPVVVTSGLAISLSFFFTFGTRYLYPVVPGILLLAGLGLGRVLDSIAPRRLLQLAAVGLMLVPQVPLLASNLLKDNQRYDFQTAARIVGKLRKADDLILAETHGALDYYTGFTSEELPQTTTELDARLRREHRRAIVVTLYQRGLIVGTNDPTLQGYIDRNLALQERIYQRRYDAYRFEVRVYRYEPPPARR